MLELSQFGLLSGFPWQRQLHTTIPTSMEPDAKGVDSKALIVISLTRRRHVEMDDFVPRNRLRAEIFILPL